MLSWISLPCCLDLPLLYPSKMSIRLLTAWCPLLSCLIQSCPNALDNTMYIHMRQSCHDRENPPNVMLETIMSYLRQSCHAWDNHVMLKTIMSCLRQLLLAWDNHVLLDTIPSCLRQSCNAWHTPAYLTYPCIFDIFLSWLTSSCHARTPLTPNCILLCLIRLKLHLISFWLENNLCYLSGW